jgi:cyclopropane-fatty-acyl-phospholipid synthase
LIDFLLHYNLIPTWLKRRSINYLLKQRLHQEQQRQQQDYKQQFLSQLANGPIAKSTEAANQQHYEVPTEFYQLVLGEHLKYSCGYWAADCKDLTQAEHAMLELYLTRAQLAEGQNILELGCGWGSLSLLIAARFPQTKITAVSNSATQAEYIRAQAQPRQLNNLHVITADMNTFDTQQKFDRIISIEMLEHMYNLPLLLKRIRAWLTADGYFFTHYFCHQNYAYPFVTAEKNSWMAQHFFTNGIMPSEDWLEFFSEDLSVQQLWRVNGMHYAKTCQAWEQHLQQHKAEILHLFAKTYGAKQANLRWHYWHLFFLACEQLFAYHGGDTWYVAHALLRPTQS